MFRSRESIFKRIFGMMILIFILKAHSEKKPLGSDILILFWVKANPAEYLQTITKSYYY